MQAAEEATGKTAQEIYKMMEGGKLLAKDFLVPFAKAMSRIVRENDALTKATEKLTSQQHRLNTAYKVLINDIFQKGGGASFFGNMFQDLARIIEQLTPIMTHFASATFTGLEMLWDIGASVIGMFVDLFAAIDRVASSSTKFSSISAAFYTIQLSVYSLLEALEELRMMLRGDSEFSLQSAVSNSMKLSPTGLISGMARDQTSRMMGGSKTVNVGGITVNTNATDAEGTAAAMMDQFNFVQGSY